MKWLYSLKPVLTAGQIQRLSNIFDNAGQVVLAVMVLSPIVGGFDKINPLVLLSGIVLVGICWVMSVVLARKAESI